MNDKFEKFTERARTVLSLAQEEARRFNHSYIGTEHLLLGLVREGDGVAAKVLDSLGADLPKVRSAVEFIIGHGDQAPMGEIGLTPRAKRVIELAVDEARRLNHHYIGTEHLLLGLIREGEGIGAGVLESLGINLERARQATLDVLSSGASGGATRLVSGDSTSALTGDFYPVPRSQRQQPNALQILLLACSLLLLGAGITQVANGIAYGMAESVGLVVTVAAAILGAFCIVQVFGLLLALRDRIVGYALVGLTALAWIAAMALERSDMLTPSAAYRDTVLAQGLGWAVLGLGALVVLMTIALAVFGSVSHSRSFPATVRLSGSDNH